MAQKKKQNNKMYMPQMRRTEKANWKSFPLLAQKGYANRSKAEKVMKFYKNAAKDAGMKVTNRFRVKAMKKPNYK